MKHDINLHEKNGCLKYILEINKLRFSGDYTEEDSDDEFET